MEGGLGYKLHELVVRWYYLCSFPFFIVIYYNV